MFNQYKQAMVDADRLDKKKRREFYQSNYFSNFSYPNDLIDAVATKTTASTNVGAKIP